MQANKSLWFVVSLIFYGGLATASEAFTVGDLARIQTETMIIKAQVKREEAHAELAKKRQSKVGVMSGTLPVLKSIYGTDKHLLARFIYPGNVIVEANEGDDIPGGYRVSKIYSEISKVDLTQGHNKFQIGFSSLAPSALQQEGGMPFVPGISR